ncbi:MAG: D-aminoacylase [Gemmatimonadetes bacterium]|nr:D-aminoacylase [Gemmatimonadota bacterium]MYG85296.1 D-aminoacylase [Gemmatimonadota bacterium]MYJ88963.1 D-aminoacylase [Gemmatimonadota bacterium]
MDWSRRNFLRRTSLVGAGAAVGGLSTMLDGCAIAQRYDVIIRGGQVIDGTGAAPVAADIAIAGDRIVQIGPVQGSGGNTIDATGKIVCPGFIDIHSHTDLSLLVDPRAESKIRQGVTTEVAGQDGSSLAPLTNGRLRSLQEGYGRRYGVDIGWTDFTGLFNTLEQQGIGLNFISLAGQGTIRGYVVGYENVPASARQVDAMKDLVDQAMSEGAWGLSSGLEYTPGSFADEDEISELGRVAAGYSGFYATHMRNEDDFLVEAVSEAISTARKAEIALQIAHFKASGRRNRDKVAVCFDMIEQAIGEGMDITLDRYPYIAYATTLQNLFPTRFRAGGAEAFVSRLQSPDVLPAMRRAAVDKVDMLGDWSAVMITSVGRAENQDYVGRRVSEIVARSGQDPFEFVRELLIAENGSVGMVGFGMSEEEITSVLTHPLVMVASDGGAAAVSGPLSETTPHPRYYGTFPRVLGKYCREEGLFDLPTAVHKMTGQPAQRLGLADRGRIDVGLVADLVVFDPDTVIDRADFMNPHQYAQGIESVLVNGAVVIDGGEHTGALPGKVLRKQAGSA